MKWYIKEFGKLTGVSVRMLHHYDKIGLLKPSLRLESGYRVYSEADLLKLETIVALKYFGFGLSKIKQLTQKKVETRELFLAQQAALQEQIAHLQSVNKTLKSTINHYEKHKSVDWTTIITLIKEYSMNKKQAEYEKYLESYFEQKYGEKGKQTYEKHKKEAQEKTKDYTQQDMDAIKRDMEELHKAFVAAINKGLKPADPEVQKLVRKHYQWVSKFWTPNRESYIGLTQTYADHPEFKAMYDSHHPKYLEFLTAAIRVFAEKELK